MGNCLSAPTQRGSGHSARQQTYAYPTIQVQGQGGQRLSEALFFPDDRMPCHKWLAGGRCTRNNCKYSHSPTSLSKLCLQLRQARRSLDICVFTITCQEIATEVVHAKRRGVNVRVITDDEKQDDLGSKASTLKSQGIAVRNDGDLSHMHHKFCVIDQAILLNGSFNWTRSAVLNNRENVVISTDAYLVSDFMAEFNRLWNEFRRNK